MKCPLGESMTTTREFDPIFIKPQTTTYDPVQNGLLFGVGIGFLLFAGWSIWKVLRWHG